MEKSRARNTRAKTINAATNGKKYAFMSSRPQEPHKKYDHGNQHRRKKGRSCPRVLRCSAFMCIAFISAHVPALLSAVYLPTDTQLSEKGSILPSRILPYQLQDEVIQDQANKDDVHQHPGKNNTVGEILFVHVFHSSLAPYLALHLHILRI